MALLEIKLMGDPVLREECEPVESVDDDLRRLADDMFETMYSAEGVGLAAPQVGITKRLIVVDPREEGVTPRALVNPTVVATGEETDKAEEGCLSIPGLKEVVERQSEVVVEALDLDGEPIRIEADGLLARVLLHEIDHLNGVLFVDRVSPLKRKMLMKKWKKVQPDPAGKAGADVRVVFWGTPEFALPTLGALLGEGHDVVAVVTQPDRPRGRGRELAPTPVKEFARAEGIPVHQPERARADEFVEELAGLEPELNVVVAYGQILSRALLETPARGSINLHPSLLPELRGAAPINWAIIRGYDVTGVTTMRMTTELDAGPILRQVTEPILPGETATDLTVRLSELGAEVMIETLALMEMDELEERPQDDDAATYAPLIERADARVDWSKPAGDVANHIRGMDAVPGAWTLRNGDEELKVYRPAVAEKEDVDPSAEAGTVLDVEPGHPEEGLLVGCGDGAVWVREVKPAGKRRMNAADWLRGRGAETGDRLT